MADILRRRFALLLLTTRTLETAKTISTLDKNYELPDGQVITIASKRFHYPVLYQPSMIGVENSCIQKNL
ncbi:unnamed protein product [Eruca vesicaria subsp. sativa]|uniref:Uncharacterized protein n=1 Tax=Eruca vesicaria subsp. sativa TaxID=29727 RepID=A0ABC8K8P4_ERUVS|nr:unnamed protein product [Eruca vesicaria subsp. sativa]